MNIGILNQKIPRVGIDLDSSSSYVLLRTYLTARHLFPNTPIKVETSKSGTGYHIRINKEVTILENIMFRYLLNDDLIRLKLSISKLFMNPEIGKDFDILFNGRGIEKIDMEHLLKPHERDINKIYERWGFMDKTVQKVAEKIEPKIPKKTVWLTCIGINGEKSKEDLKQVCLDISEKDSSFKWKLYQDYGKKYDYLLVIFSGSKNEAHRRGVWFHHKVDKKLLYWVKMKK